ncbi:MAG: enoyl-CoA hydratase/isomerase family protein [Archaeoglobaceae archaeon]
MKVKLELGEVARIKLNRPEKKNALDSEMLQDLRRAVDEVASSDARVLVLSGEGDTFCAGLDIGLLTSFASMDEEEFRQALEFVQKLIIDIRNLEIPIIAAVQRYAIGGGMQLALAADIRLATPGTVFYLREPEFGIIPDMGALYILPRLVGDGVAKELVFTRKRITAEEAKQLGLVNAVCEDLESCVDEYVRKILEVPKHVLSEAKKAIEHSWNESFEENMRRAAEAQMRCFRKLKGL